MSLGYAYTCTLLLAKFQRAQTPTPPPGQAMPPLPPYLSPGQLPGPLFIYYSTPHPVLLFFFYTNFYHARMHHHANHDLKLLLELGIFLVKLTPELT